MSEASIFSMKREARSSAEGERRLGKVNEKSREVCTNQWVQQVDQDNRGVLPSSTAGPFKDVDHERNVIPSWPIV